MKLKDRKGIPYPVNMKFRSWIVVGPPGCGKSYLIQRIGGYPGEVAEAILWLMSDASSYTTGSFIDVSGGR